MSSPTTDVDFDGAIARAWAAFAADLTRRVTDSAVRFSFDTDAVVDGAADPTAMSAVLRPMADAASGAVVGTVIVGAVVAVPAGTPTAAYPDWSSVAPGHLGRFADPGAVTGLVAAVVDIARSVWGVPHPSFLRDDTAARDRVESAERRRSRAMADHPSASLSRVAARVVRERLDTTVDVATHDCVELTYPTASASLQVWGEHRSALFWTTVRGAVDPDTIARTRGLIDLPVGFEMVVDGTVVDIEFAVDLTSHPRSEMAAAVDRWHEFMSDDLPALTELLTAPGTADELDTPHALRVALTRSRTGDVPEPDEMIALMGSDRAAVFDALEVCRRLSASWLRWADTRSARADIDGVQLAVAEAQLFDTVHARLTEALRHSMLPHHRR